MFCRVPLLSLLDNEINVQNEFYLLHLPWNTILSLKIYQNAVLDNPCML